MKFSLLVRLTGRQRTAWILNVLCLSVAFAVFFIVIKQVKYDLSFDQGYPKGENIYQLGCYNPIKGKYEPRLSMPMVREILDPIPEIEASTMLSSIDNNRKTSFYCGEDEYQNIPWYSASPGFFQVFQPRIVMGDAVEALESGQGMIIARSLAEKWFGKQNPIDKQIGFGQKGNIWSVKAVYEDFPENSSMQNGVIVKLYEDQSKSMANYFCFMRTRDGVPAENLTKKIVQITDSLYQDSENFSSKSVFEARPIQDQYFSPDTREFFPKHGNWALTLCFLAIGILVILVAYINFINFSTALAPSRIETLNICKVMGASAAKLRRNVVAEAICLSLLGWILAFGWIEAFSGSALAKAYFSASLGVIGNPGLYFLLGGGAFFLGVLAGLYPAYYMTSFQPAMVLKGSFALSGSGRRLRNSLLVFQFVVTIVLVTASFFVVIQHDYLVDMPLGYDKENIVYTSYFQRNASWETFRSEIMKNPDVIDMTYSGFIPGEIRMMWNRKIMDTLNVSFYSWPVAANFLSFFKIPVYEGDSLRKPPAGKDYAILNRRMVEKFNMQHTLGQEVFDAFSNKVTVLGFAENINFNSLHNEIEPMAFACGDDLGEGSFLVKIRPERIHETVKYLKESFENFGAEQCQVTFLDDYLNRLYQQEENLSRLIFLFCLITVIISLAGIYGLILFNIRYKVKEIGIRKINGASGLQVLWMLNRVFIRLLIWSFIIACPVAYYLVQAWLAGYPYRTPVYWWVFVLGFLLTMFITLITVCYQSNKAANANPVDALKTE